MAQSNPTNYSSNQQCAVLWLDSEANNNEDNLMAQQKLFNTFNNVEIFEDENDCQQFIRSKPKQPIFLIVSGRLSRQIVPAIDPLEQISAIYIYCMNKSKHEEWAKAFLKIKGIIVELDQLVSQIQSDLKAIVKKKPPTDSTSNNNLANLFPQPVTNSVDELIPTFQATGITASSNNKSSHLDGYDKVPLVSLEEAVAPLVNIVDDVAQMVWIVKQNSQNPEEGLNNDESASIALYTMEWYPKEKSFFYILNETLRSENNQQMKPWFRYLKLVFKALSKLQTVSHIIYQGTNEDVSNNYPKGKVFISWEFLTCTASIKTLENEETFGKSGRRTLFTIESRSGKDIRRHAFEQSKDQVLLLPGRQFQVISCLNPDDELNIIQLEEMKSLYSFE